MGRPRQDPRRLVSAQDWRRRQKADGRCVYCANKAVWSVRLVRRLVTCERHRQIQVQRQADRRQRLGNAAWSKAA